ncbi:MAG: hypothetical protein R2932_12630 [Caldilineaceae bacterium]
MSRRFLYGFVGQEAQAPFGKAIWWLEQANAVMLARAAVESGVGHRSLR